MRASQRESHALFSPSTRNSAVLMTPDPTSTPIETVMKSSLYPYSLIGCVASEGGAPFVARRAVNLHGCALPHCAPPPAATPPDPPVACPSSRTLRGTPGRTFRTEAECAFRGLRAVAGRLAQRADLVGFLPGELGELPPEVTEGRRLPVDGAQQVQLADDPGRP